MATRNRRRNFARRLTDLGARLKGCCDLKKRALTGMREPM
jgi:hypothetical protein